MTFTRPVADPPLPEISDDVPAVYFYADEDGGYWVPVEEEADERRAWQRLEASLSLPMFASGRVTVSVADCEIGHHCDPFNDGDPEPGCDAHPECPKVPCPGPVATDCWSFEDAASDDRWRAGAGYQWGGS